MFKGNSEVLGQEFTFVIKKKIKPKIPALVLVRNIFY